MDYSQLEIWNSPENIKHAVQIARNAMEFSRTKEIYFTDNPDEFYPHIWVVAAICTALEEDTYNEGYKDGYSDGNRLGRAIKCALEAVQESQKTN